MLTQRRPATSRQTSVEVWGSGRRGRRPQAAAHPIVRLSTIREPPPAEVSRQCRPAIRKEPCGFADLGRSNLWRPMVVDRTGGSRWVQAQPAGSRWVQARACPSRQCRPVISRRFLEIRRIREVRSMLPEFVAGTRGSNRLSALPTGGSKWLSALPTCDFQKISGNPQNSGSPIYASRIRRWNPR